MSKCNSENCRCGDADTKCCENPNGNTVPCFKDGNQCVCGQNERCPELIAQFSKVVWCKDYDCLWNQKSGFKKFIDLRKNHQHFEDDAFEGFCSRPEIGLRNIHELDTSITGQVMKVLGHAICCVRSSVVKDHIDFSKYPQGGNISGQKVDKPGTKHFYRK